MNHNAYVCAFKCCVICSPREILVYLFHQVYAKGVLYQKLTSLNLRSYPLMSMRWPCIWSDDLEIRSLRKCYRDSGSKLKASFPGHSGSSAWSRYSDQTFWKTIGSVILLLYRSCLELSVKLVISQQLMDLKDVIRWQKNLYLCYLIFFITSFLKETSYKVQFYLWPSFHFKLAVNIYTQMLYCMELLQFIYLYS